MPGSNVGLHGGPAHPMGGGYGRSAQSSKHGVLPAWTSVTLRGLKSAAHHNGKVGQTESYDAEAGRYAVRLADGTGIQIKYDNLLQRVEVECVGTHGEQQVKLDGRIAMLVGQKFRKQLSRCLTNLGNVP